MVDTAGSSRLLNLSMDVLSHCLGQTDFGFKPSSFKQAPTPNSRPASVGAIASQVISVKVWNDTALNGRIFTEHAVILKIRRTLFPSLVEP